jgi:hypothetical protein
MRNSRLSITARRIHTAQLTPQDFAIKLIIGKVKNTGTNVATERMNVFRTPSPLTSGEKKATWNRPEPAPYRLMIYPMVTGSRSSPPMGTGMWKNRGRRALTDMLRKARVT